MENPAADLPPLSGRVTPPKRESPWRIFIDPNENGLERSKSWILLLLIAISVVGEVALIMIDLLTGSPILNNALILASIALALVALTRRRKTLAVYLVLMPFTIDFFRVYFTGGGVQTHALPLFFLLLVEALYLLPLRHALAYVIGALAVMNFGELAQLPATLAIQESVEAAADPQRRFIVLNAIAIAITAIFATVFYYLNKYFRQLEHQNAHLDELVQRRTAELARERERSEKLLLNILPEGIASRLKREEARIVDDFDQASVLFADFAGFTPFSKTLSASDLVDVLNAKFSAIDGLVEKHGLEKIKTIGDAYMVASGIPEPTPDHLTRLAEFALELRDTMAGFTTSSGAGLPLRIGMHTGPVVAGVIGSKKFMYDLWGETVNLASRMESTGVAGKIQVTPDVYDYLGEDYLFSARGEIDVKGAGLIPTYFLDRKR